MDRIIIQGKNKNELADSICKLIVSNKQSCIVLEAEKGNPNDFLVGFEDIDYIIIIEPTNPEILKRGT